MGATRESNCSAGILAALFCGDDAGSCELNDTSAKVSPSERTVVQRIATKDRTVAPFVFRIMGPRLMSNRNRFPGRRRNRAMRLKCSADEIKKCRVRMVPCDQGIISRDSFLKEA